MRLRSTIVPSATLPMVEAAELGDWCGEHLGSTPGEILFTTGHLSYVVGLRLADGRGVVVKVRPPRPELAACAMIHQGLWEAGC